MIKKVLIMAGGTGGHIFPALVIAKKLLNKHIDVAWLGSQKGLEAQLVLREHIPIYSVSISGLRRKGLLPIIFAPIRLCYALVHSINIILRYRPDVVLGMGGFVTGPGGLAAVILRKKLVIHEQNSVMGLTNKILSHFSAKVFTGFPLLQDGRALHYVGNPIRKEIIDVGISKHEVAFETPKTYHSFNVLIFGGSQGSSCFNEVIPKFIIERFIHSTFKVQHSKSVHMNIWHQTGKKDFEETKRCYQNGGITAKVETFIENMAKAYDWADLVISRAGALTISELTAIGIPAILVPYVHAVDDHQTENAKFLSDQSAALLVLQHDFNEAKLCEIFMNFLSNPAILTRMGQKSYQLRKIDADDQMISYLMA